MRLTAMLDFWLWSSWLTIKKLAPKINIFYRPSGGQIAKNPVGGLFFEAKKFTWTCCQTNKLLPTEGNFALLKLALNVSARGKLALNVLGRAFQWETPPECFHPN